MKVIKPYYEILTPINGMQILKQIEMAGRVCYKSEDKISDDSAPKFVKMLIDRGHEAMIEHGGIISVKFVCDRGVSHELVRHRIASFAQESTRYCNYAKDKFGNQIIYIQPCWFKFNDYTMLKSEELIELVINPPDTMPDDEYLWLQNMLNAEINYNKLIDSSGWQPQQARSILPNSLKTEIVVTMNMRELRHFFKLRTAKAAHPQMRELTIPLLKQLQDEIPVLFDDIRLED